MIYRCDTDNKVMSELMNLEAKRSMQKNDMFDTDFFYSPSGH